MTEHAEGTFEVASFTPVEVTPAVVIETALPAGVATMEKRYAGDVEGRSGTLFTGAQGASGVGTYVALESFAGALRGASGGFTFVHAASTSGSDRSGEFFAIVPGSGSGGLAGIRGSGGMTVDADGTHRIWFDYDLPDS